MRLWTMPFSAWSCTRTDNTQPASGWPAGPHLQVKQPTSLAQAMAPDHSLTPPPAPHPRAVRQDDSECLDKNVSRSTRRNQADP